MSDSIQCLHLLQELQRLTKRLSEIAKRDFGEMSETQINWKPQSDKWSIAQCLLHLNYYASYYFDTADSSIKEAQKKQYKATLNYKKGKLGKKYIADVRLKRNNKIKTGIETKQDLIPSSSNSTIDGQKELATFLNNQALIDEMLEAAKLLPLGKIRIPFSWWGLYKIKLGDLLQVLVYHTERHIIQAQRVHYHDNFPISDEIKK